MTRSMENTESWAGWIATGVVAIIGALWAAIRSLYKVIESNNAKHIKSLRANVEELKKGWQACEKHRRELLVTVARLEERIKLIEEQLKH